MALFLALLPGAVLAQTNRASLLLTITNPLAGDFDHFGSSVAVVGGDMLLIGMDSIYVGPGKVHLFSTNGSLLTTFTNPALNPYGFGDGFGNAVAAVGNDRVLIGAYLDAETFLFNTNGTLLTTLASPPYSSLGFGWSVAALNSDRLLVGNIYDSTGATNAGVAYLFSTNGTLLSTFTNPFPTPSNYFGYSLTTIGNDRVLIGSPYSGSTSNQGAVYLFDTNGTLLITFTNAASNSAAFGISLATLGDSQVLISSLSRAYLFSTNGNLLTTFASPPTGGGAVFGGSIASVGMDRVLVGSWGHPPFGAAWLFNTNGNHLTTFTSPNLNGGRDFGVSIVAVGGERVLIGAPKAYTYSNIYAGVAHFFYAPTNYEPAISFNTTTKSVPQGTNVSFSVSAIGTPPFIYQWSYKTNPIPDQTNSVLSLTNVQTSDAGNYFVTVTNLYGAATSGVVRLSVSVPLTITSHPLSATNTIGDLAAFTVVATSSSLRYQWFFGSNTLPDATNSTLTLTNVARTNSGYYYVVITNFASSATSSNALLVVRAPQRILPLTSLGGDHYRISFADDDGGLLFDWDLSSLEVQGSTNMSSTNWVTLTNALVISNGVGQVEFVVTNSPPQQFYRVRMR